MYKLTKSTLTKLSKDQLIKLIFDLYDTYELPEEATASILNRIKRLESGISKYLFQMCTDAFAEDTNPELPEKIKLILSDILTSLFTICYKVSSDKYEDNTELSEDILLICRNIDEVLYASEDGGEDNGHDDE